MKSKTDLNDTKVFALGGLGEVGKNMYVIMHNDELIIIDAGVMFPEDELLGIDYVLADYAFLKQNQNKIKCLIITHGHEDHIGGISFLVNEVNIPKIFAPKIAFELIKKKLADRGVTYKNLIEYDESKSIKTKYFNIDFYITTHSIPDSYGIIVRSPNGTIVSTGDFKFDMTPVGPMANLQKMAKLGNDGVKLLLSDSTNALTPGFSKSESSVDDAMGEIFSKSTGRIIIATFASNIYRLSHIIETCRKNDRKIAIFGRSMKNNIEIAVECGYIDGKNIFISGEEANKLPLKDVCLLCTGSQGEPLAALSRIANGTDKNITLMPDDSIIFSSSPIPGNAMGINRIINKLYLKGATVYTNTELSDIHTSGHAKAEDLKLLLRLIKPEYFMPMHGEYRMLKAHADIAVQCGVKKENCFVLKNGDMLSVNKKGVQKVGSFPVSDVYVDGNRIGDIGNVVIKDRKIMSTDGVLVVILNIDPNTKKQLIAPNITTRGFVVVNENAELIRNIQNRVKETTDKFLENNSYLNYTDLKNSIILDLNSYITELMGRRPIILPMILEVKGK